MLEDNQSKFGTLVLVKQRTPLLPGYNKAVQVGRTVINFSVKALNNNNKNAGNIGEVNIDDDEQPTPKEQLPRSQATQEKAIPYPTVPLLHGVGQQSVPNLQSTGANWAQDEDIQI